MYAVVETGGKQYRVSPGDTIDVETIAGDVDADVDVGRVLMISGDDGRLLTGDELADAKVTGTIASHGRAKKVVVFKFKRKKQYRRTIGHRQNFTRLKVTAILPDGQPAAGAAETSEASPASDEPAEATAE
jgi:large subunit ribosomal protein L21